jgi:hypothetical protein
MPHLASSARGIEHVEISGFSASGGVSTVSAFRQILTGATSFCECPKQILNALGKLDLLAQFMLEAGYLKAPRL